MSSDDRITIDACLCAAGVGLPPVWRCLYDGRAIWADEAYVPRDGDLVDLSDVVTAVGVGALIDRLHGLTRTWAMFGLSEDRALRRAIALHVEKLGRYALEAADE